MKGTYGPVAKVPFDSEVDAPPGVCWNCFRPGHQHPDCSYPKRIFCLGCGRANVIDRHCPRCAEGHRDHQKERKKLRKSQDRQRTRRVEVHRQNIQREQERVERRERLRVWEVRQAALAESRRQEQQKAKETAAEKRKRIF